MQVVGLERTAVGHDGLQQERQERGPVLFGEIAVVALEALGVVAAQVGWHAHAYQQYFGTSGPGSGDHALQVGAGLNQ